MNILSCANCCFVWFNYKSFQKFAKIHVRKTSAPISLLNHLYPQKRQRSVFSFLCLNKGRLVDTACLSLYPSASEREPFPLSHWLRYLICLSAFCPLGTRLHFICLDITCNLGSEFVILPNQNYLALQERAWGT